MTRILTFIYLYEPMLRLGILTAFDRNLCSKERQFEKEVPERYKCPTHTYPPCVKIIETRHVCLVSKTYRCQFLWNWDIKILEHGYKRKPMGFIFRKIFSEQVEWGKIFKRTTGSLTLRAEIVAIWEISAHRVGFGQLYIYCSHKIVFQNWNFKCNSWKEFVGPEWGVLVQRPAHLEELTPGLTSI